MAKQTLDQSKYQARRINPLTGNWDPANWDTSRINYDAIAEEAEVVIIRVGDGLNLDPCFERFRAEYERRNVLWGIYHLHRPSVSPEAQVAFIRQHQPLLPPAGVWPDLEFEEGRTGEAYYARTNPYLTGLDLAYAVTVGLYSAAWFLNKVLSPAIQRRWRHRLGWWASYPNLYIPWGWADADPTYGLHQYTSEKVWRGLPKPADASNRNPLLPLPDLLRRVTGRVAAPVPVPPAPPVPSPDRGTRIGIHAIRPGQTMPLIRTLKERGAKVASVLAVEQAGLLMDVKAVSPDTLRIWRIYTPQFDGLQDIHLWSPEAIQAAFSLIAQYTRDRWDRLAQEERDAIQLIAVLNEADPQGPVGYRNYGTLCRLLCEWATGRGIRLLLPGHNNGTPEYAEVVQFFSGGAAEAMVAGRHALNLHEGVDPPQSTGRMAVDVHPLPGGPFPVPGAGTLALRYRHTVDHLRRTGHPVPDLYLGEFYGGAYGVQDVPGTLANFMFFDQTTRTDPWLKAFHGFTMDPDEGWQGQNYNPLMTSPGLIEYIIRERERTNATVPTPLPDAIAGGGQVQYLITVPAEVTAGVLRSRIGAVDLLDLRAVVPMDNTPSPPAWYELWPVGVISPTRTLEAPGVPVVFYKRDGTPMVPQPLLDAQGQPRPVTWTMQVSENVFVQGLSLLRVVDNAGSVPDWYVRAVDVVPFRG